MEAGGLGFAIPAGITLGATGGLALGLAAGIGVGGAFYLLGRTLYKLTTNSRRRKVEVMFDRLAERIGALISHHTLPDGPGPEALPPGLDSTTNS